MVSKLSIFWDRASTFWVGSIGVANLAGMGLQAECAVPLESTIQTIIASFCGAQFHSGHGSCETNWMVVCHILCLDCMNPFEMELECIISMA